MTTKKKDLEQAMRRAAISNDPHSCAESLTPRAHQHRVRYFLLLLLLPLFLLSLFGCPLYNPAAFIEKPITQSGQQQSGPSGILSTAAQATLQWNPPATGASQVVSYTISYRVHGTSTWTLLATIPAASQPSYLVLRSVVGSGTFDFAVASVDSGGISSPLATSLDPTANPAGGWYLSW